MERLTLIGSDTGAWDRVYDVSHIALISTVHRALDVILPISMFCLVSQIWRCFISISAEVRKANKVQLKTKLKNIGHLPVSDACFLVFCETCPISESVHVQM
jgi:hypothetical protein